MARLKELAADRQERPLRRERRRLLRLRLLYRHCLEPS